MKRILFTLVMLVVLVVPMTPVMAQDGSSGEDWSITGPVPDEVIPLKFENGEANEDSCNIPGACWFFAEAGVLSAARWEDAQANESAVWSGAGDVQELLENETADLILPETGYMQIVGAGFDVTCGDYSYSLEPSEDHVWFLNLRGLHDGPGDRNTVCHFSNYTPGAVLVTMYAIPVHASAFFSQGYFRDNVENAFIQKNCGATGCSTASMLQSDINDGAYAVETAELANDVLEISLVETNTVTN